MRSYQFLVRNNTDTPCLSFSICEDKKEQECYSEIRKVDNILYENG